MEKRFWERVTGSLQRGSLSMKQVSNAEAIFWLMMLLIVMASIAAYFGEFGVW